MNLSPEYAHTLRERIRSRVTIEDRGYRTPCWISHRARGGSQQEYTKIGVKIAPGCYKTWYTHRIAYVLWVGPIPDGLQVDHRCDQPDCCNPDHLAAVGSRENLLRSRNRVSHQRAQTKCIHGHPFTPDNTYVDPLGRRHCLACKRRRRRRTS